MKVWEKRGLMLLLALTAISICMGGYHLAVAGPYGSRWLGTSGLLATMAGVVQLEVSGLFQRIMDLYGDEDKYPFGPPSSIVREIIDHPDRPVATWLRNTTFHNLRTGFWLIVVGTLIQIVGAWV
jgi:hypothetical protein